MRSHYGATFLNRVRTGTAGVQTASCSTLDVDFVCFEVTVDFAETFHIFTHRNCRNSKLISFKETFKNFKDSRKYKPLYSSLELASGTVWFMLSHVLPFTTMATGMYR